MFSAARSQLLRAMPWATVVLLAEMAAGAPLIMPVLLLPLPVERLHGVEAMLAAVVGRRCPSFTTSMKNELRDIANMKVASPRSDRIAETTLSHDIMSRPQTFRWCLRHILYSLLTARWPLGCPDFAS